MSDPQGGIFQGTFVGNVTYFVTSRLPYIYLASLILAYFVARAKVDPEARVEAVIEVSATLTMYYAFLAFAIGFLVNLPPVFANLIFQVILLWAIVAYYNLFLTAFGYVWTFAKKAGGESQQPEQNLLNILFDTRLVRPKPKALYDYLGDIPVPTIELLFKFGEPVWVWLSGKECTNTWSGPNRRLTFVLNPKDVSENFMGKLCWYLEDSALGGESSLGGAGRCGWLRVMQALYTFLGFFSADSFFQMAINDNSLDQSPFRAQSVDDIFNPGNKFLRQNGVACNKNDLSDFFTAISSSSDRYQRSLQASRIISAINKVPFSLEDYAKQTNQDITSPNFTLTPLDERVLDKFSPEFSSSVRTQYLQLTNAFTQQKSIDFTKVYAYYDNREMFNALGLRTDLIQREVDERRLGLNQDLPEEMGKYLLGDAATINGVDYDLDTRVREAAERAIANFGDQNDCQFEWKDFSCCDTKFRPYNPDLGERKVELVGTSGRYYQIQLVNY